MKRQLIAVAALALTACGVRSPAASSGADKVFVCKYVRKPGAFELLQTGQNPISVSVDALVGPGVDVQVGDEFSDGQGKSVVIAFDIGQPEPDVSQCPGYVRPTTTTTVATTTTMVGQPPPPPGPTTTVRATTTTAPRHQPPPPPAAITTTIPPRPTAPPRPSVPPVSPGRPSPPAPLTPPSTATIKLPVTL